MTKDELMAQLDEDDTVYVDAMLDTMAEADALRAKLADAEARVAELEVDRDNLHAEYRRLWNAGIDHANSGGTVEAGKPEMTYAALFRTLMQSRFWNESIVANAAPGAQR